MNTMFGFPVITSPLVQPVPVLTFDPAHKLCWATPEFRAEMNAWLLERFGTKEVAYIFDPHALRIMGNQTIVMHPETVARLKRRLNAGVYFI